MSQSDKELKQLAQDQEFRRACELVEVRCRQLGKDCQVIFMAKGGVSVAPLSWAGDSTGRNLYEAMMDAEASM